MESKRLEEQEQETVEAKKYEAKEITVEEWQGWGSDSQVPEMVKKVIDGLNLWESERDIQLRFNAPKGKLKGAGRIEEEKKRKGAYKTLDSDEKLQYFAARQVAYRLLGSRGYLCQHCWLPVSDCMCSGLSQQALWQGIHFWIYMHPKEFLQKNNTGKLLWQVFGKKSAKLCIFGMREHEETMMNSFKEAGKQNVWCLYPDRNSNAHSVDDLNISKLENSSSDGFMINEIVAPVHFILVDGTWRNSKSMFSRLKEFSIHAWGEEALQCLSFSDSFLSAMHRLRPQPSLDKTCTAAAALHLLDELSSVPALKSQHLDQSAKALEDALMLLLQALVVRRKRFGKPVIREGRCIKTQHCQ